jgi:hypothetical protein
MYPNWNFLLENMDLATLHQGEEKKKIRLDFKKFGLALNAVRLGRFIFRRNFHPETRGNAVVSSCPTSLRTMFATKVCDPLKGNSKHYLLLTHIYSSNGSWKKRV